MLKVINPAGSQLLQHAKTVLDRIAKFKTLCDEIKAIATQDYKRIGEPLRWSMHG